MRDILVPVADRPECARALQTAFDLGTRLGASVTGLHIRPHRHSDVKKGAKKSPASARAMFEELANRNGFALTRRSSIKQTAVWAEKVGSPAKLMAILGPVSDLIIVSRPAKAGGNADLFLTAALIESGRPVLVLPQRNPKVIGRRICVGWNQSTDAARAVTAAIPLLQQADEVTIITCGAEDKVGPKAAHLASYLRNWGVRSRHVSTPGRDVDGELLEACWDANADLLIGGAYSRRRWQEKIFGGTTEMLTHKARLPVLLLHC
jgi:nucleotide-binding universal stress UspA family protein